MRFHLYFLRLVCQCNQRPLFVIAPQGLGLFASAAALCIKSFILKVFQLSCFPLLEFQYAGYSAFSVRKLYSLLYCNKAKSNMYSLISVIWFTFVSQIFTSLQADLFSILSPLKFAIFAIFLLDFKFGNNLGREHYRVLKKNQILFW